MWSFVKMIFFFWREFEKWAFRFVSMCVREWNATINLRITCTMKNGLRDTGGSIWSDGEKQNKKQCDETNGRQANNAPFAFRHRTIFLIQTNTMAICYANMSGINIFNVIASKVWVCEWFIDATATDILITTLLCCRNWMKCAREKVHG